MVPVLNLTMTDRIVDAVSGIVGNSKSLIADEEVQVLRPPLGG